MQLREALGIRHSEMASLIGAGGKTTTLFALAKELRNEGGKILVTTTTQIFKPTKPHVDRLFLVENIDVFPEEIARIAAPIIIGAGYHIDEDDKLIGFPPAWLDTLEQRRLFDALLVEADSAASRLFKVPSEVEPVIPRSCHLVIWVMAIKVLGKPLDSTHVHRAERAVALLSVPPGTILNADHVVRLVKHPEGCLKGIPARSRTIALLTQADTPEEIQNAKELARALLPLGFERAIIASHLKENPVEEVMMR